MATTTTSHYREIPRETKEEETTSNKQRCVSELQNVAWWAGSIVSVGGYLSGGIKLMQLAAKALLVTLPRYWDYVPSYTEEDVNFYTFLAVSPVLLYHGVQCARMQYQNYRKDRQGEEDWEHQDAKMPPQPLDSEPTSFHALVENHSSGLIKSLSTSPNIPVLYTTICLQLAKYFNQRETLNPYITVGLMVFSFTANYYCQISVYENANKMHTDRERSAPAYQPRSCSTDGDAKTVAVLDSLISTAVITDAVASYSKIDWRQHPEAFIAELTSVGFLSLLLAWQNQKKMVEFKRRGQYLLANLIDSEPVEEMETSYVNKKTTLIHAAARTRSLAIGGSVADLIVKTEKLFSNVERTALPAPAIGIFIFYCSFDVLKNYSARGCPNYMELTENLTPVRIASRQSRATGSTYSPLPIHSPPPVSKKNWPKLRYSRSLESPLNPKAALPNIPSSLSGQSGSSINSDEGPEPIVSSIANKN